MNHWKIGFCAAACWCLLAATAQAQSTTAPVAVFVPQAAPDGLPANERARALIDNDPRVVQARRSLDAARHRAEMLKVGPHEWTARASAQKRRYSNGPGDSTEWSVGLERAFRIGGKAALDRQLAEAQLRLAEAQLGEAKHDSARDLLEFMVGWQAAEHVRKLWETQAGFAQDNLKAVSTRRRAGDASLLDENVANADVADVQRQLSNARTEEAKQRARFAARFGEQPLQPLPATDPIALQPEASLWRERILGESDVLKIAQQELQQAELKAKRFSADRIADPTFGVHTASEARGSERVIGISISIPLGGTYRNAQISEALQQAEASRAALERVQRDLEAEVAQNLAEAAGSLERWQFAEKARTASQQNAQLTQRAYSLGEADLQAVLIARRQALDGALGAAQARIDSLRARYRLLVDAHLIWDLHDD